ncbi:hypothetical protein [uncultured Bacteroides sp.]|uniref:hypothetical protein n=1 Tax=uncultured Bacteroides sp. TaxID=162156 RepID=UPI0025FE38D6|nr:hypothetical protein [uncultured Bacteroides sp.]
MLYQEKDFQVIYSKKNKRIEEAVKYLSRSQHRLKVEYAQRKEFLKPFVPLLLNKEKGHGLTGAKELAEALHLLVDFMDADGGTNTLNTNCIETEIYKIYHKMYPDHPND